MSKTSETDHAKNVANFEELFNYAVSYNQDYNPSREALQVEALQITLTNGKKCMADYNSAFSPYKMAAAERKVAFEPLSKLTTRLLNSLKATETTVQMDETAQSLARKIKGERASAKNENDPAQQGESSDAEAKQISASQISYDNRLDNFSKFILHLQNIPQFKPNETELKHEALQAVYDNMAEKNNKAKLTGITLSNARIARDKVLYEPLTGLVDIASDTKTYIKSL